MKEKITPPTDEWQNIKTQTDQKIKEILKYEIPFYPRLQPDVIDIVSKVITDSAMLKSYNDLINRAREIDDADDPISRLYSNTYGSLLYMDKDRISPRSSPVSSENVPFNMEFLRKRIQRAELKIQIAKRFFPDSKSASEAFGNSYEENAAIVLNRLVNPPKQSSFIFRRRPVQTIRPKDNYL